MQTKILKFNKNVSLNNSGKDYFVGDIHGHYTLLLKQLDSINFNFRKDRLFAVGDIIDRGTESERCIELLMEPWFHSVIGNHEHLLLRAFENIEHWQLLSENGSKWIQKWLNFPEKLLAWAHLIRIKMPLSISVNTKFGCIGVVHADAPTDWERLTNIQGELQDLIPYLWHRQKFYDLDKDPIVGVDAVFHGHNQVENAIVYNNQIWADTLQRTGKLCIMSAEEVIRYINKNDRARVKDANPRLEN